jgi:hypothetical protein
MTEKEQAAAIELLWSKWEGTPEEFCAFTARISAQPGYLNPQNTHHAQLVGTRTESLGLSH